jgi:hypothetical protein
MGGAGSRSRVGYESVSQGYGSSDPDLYRNVTDPKHWKRHHIFQNSYKFEKLFIFEYPQSVSAYFFLEIFGLGHCSISLSCNKQNKKVRIIIKYGIDGAVIVPIQTLMSISSSSPE